MSLDRGEKGDYKLPTPTFPTMDMPEDPVTGAEKTKVHMSCEGECDELRDPAASPVLPEAPGTARILIGIPILNFTHEFVISFLKFWTELCTIDMSKEKVPFHVGYHFVYRRPVHMAESEIVRVAQWNKCTHILWMDDDIYDVKADDLRKLLHADKDFIGGVMHASKFPHAMCVFRRYDTNKKVIDMPADNSMFRLYEVPCRCEKCGFGLSHWDAKFCPVCGAAADNVLQKADLIPFAFTLMKIGIFDKIKQPWFHCTDGYPTDSWFADRCIEAGIQEWAHMGVRLNHNGVTDVTKPFLMQMEMEKKKAQNNQGVVHMTPEEMEKHQYLLHSRMQEAEEKLRPKVELIK